MTRALGPIGRKTPTEFLTSAGYNQFNQDDKLQRQHSGARKLQLGAAVNSEIPEKKILEFKKGGMIQLKKGFKLEEL